MNAPTNPDAYGTLIEPTTLKIQRMLPGPIERVWAYLTDSELRRKWLAAGSMQLEVGSSFEFVWRNDELSSPPGKRPEGFPEENRMQSRITELEPLPAHNIEEEEDAPHKKEETLEIMMAK